MEKFYLVLRSSVPLNFILFYSYRKRKPILLSQYRNCHFEIKLTQRTVSFMLEDCKVENKFEKPKKRKTFPCDIFLIRSQTALK